MQRRRRSVNYGPSSSRWATQKISDPVQKLWGKRKPWDEYDDIMVEKREAQMEQTCVRGENRVWATLWRVTTSTTARFATEYCWSVCWDSDFNIRKRDRNCGIHPDLKKKMKWIQISSGKIALTQAFWGVPECQHSLFHFSFDRLSYFRIAQRKVRHTLNHWWS